MAKMFYTLEEAASKLGVAPDQVRQMASSGQIQEFRDRDKLVFKVEQINMLVSGGEEEDSIPLADSGAGISLADDAKSSSGSGSAVSDASTKDKSGISIFEGEDGDTDASAQTQITASVGGMPMNMGDPGASGSGLLDVTRSADDTSLNAGLLEDVYQGGGQGSGDASTDQGGGGLFESTGVPSDVGAAMAGAGGMAMIAAEPYDATWSGIGGGLALALVLILGAGMAVMVMAISGVSGFALTTFLAGNIWMSVGIFAGLIVLGAGVGFVLGRKG